MLSMRLDLSEQGLQEAALQASYFEQSYDVARVFVLQGD